MRLGKESYDIFKKIFGSGKTTAIQNLCNELPGKKKVLYLTYNKLLNFKILQERGILVGVSDLIQKVIQIKPPIEKYDILIIDEYQDIEQELAE